MKLSRPRRRPGGRLVKHLALVLLLAGALACSESDEPAPKAAATPGPQDHPAMPPTGHRVEWGTPGVPCTMKAGAKVPVAVVVKNTGDQTWYHVATTITGHGAVRLGARWWSQRDAKVPAVDYTQVRGDLRANLAPGESAALTVEVTAPSTPGAYLLQLDLVEELVVWFENRGAARLMAPVTVN